MSTESDAIRARLEADMARFFKAGGEVTQVPFGESGEKRITSKRRSRKETLEAQRAVIRAKHFSDAGRQP